MHFILNNLKKIITTIQIYPQIYFRINLNVRFLPPTSVSATGVESSEISLYAGLCTSVRSRTNSGSPSFRGFLAVLFSGNACAGNGATTVAGMDVGLIIEFGCGLSAATFTTPTEIGVCGSPVAGIRLKSMSDIGDGPNLKTPGFTAILLIR